MSEEYPDICSQSTTSCMYGNVYEVEFDGPVASISTTPVPVKVAAPNLEEAIRKARTGWIQNDVVGVKMILRNVQWYGRQVA